MKYGLKHHLYLLPDHYKRYFLTILYPRNSKILMLKDAIVLTCMFVMLLIAFSKFIEMVLFLKSQVQI